MDLPCWRPPAIPGLEFNIKILGLACKGHKLSHTSTQWRTGTHVGTHASAPLPCSLLQAPAGEPSITFPQPGEAIAVTMRRAVDQAKAANLDVQVGHFPGSWYPALCQPLSSPVYKLNTLDRMHPRDLWRTQAALL